jgi:hypothetical protein
MHATGLVLTIAGLRELVTDLRIAGKLPQAILISKADARDVKFELMAGSKEHSKDAEETVDSAIAFVEGIPVMTHPHIERGKCRILLPNNESLAVA